MNKYPLFFLAFLVHTLSAQNLVPGQSYLSNDGYTEYIAGNMPLILSAPHGGYLTPDTIPDRDCTGCSYLRDTYTQELSRDVAKAVHERTGCYPHVIINRLHRRKLDANRDLPEAADGDPIAGEAWHAFHAFLDSARTQITATRGRGLFIDVHGHAHNIQRLELGYLLTSNNLQLSDNQLNGQPYLGYSSIQTLVNDNLGGLSHTELIRGESSLGELMNTRGYPAVPSASDPFPMAADPYFNGGYNTNRYGSDDGGAFDAIQIECNGTGVRDNLTSVKKFADSLAVGLVSYIQTHYFADAPAQWCQASSEATDIQNNLEKLKVFPNPFSQSVSIAPSFEGRYTATWYNLLGQQLAAPEVLEGPVKLSSPPVARTYYWLRICSEKTGSSRFFGLQKY